MAKTDRKRRKPTLTAKQKLALPLILSGKNITEGCALARIHRDSFYRWMRESEAFREEYERLSHELVKDALLEMRTSLKGAIVEIQKIAFAKITDVISFNESGVAFLKNSEDIPEDVAAAIESIQVTEEAVHAQNKEEQRFVLRTRVKMCDKLRANQILADHNMRLVEMDQIIKRIDRMEELAKER